MQGASVFGARELNDIRIFFEVVQTLPDIVAMEFSSNRMRNIVKLFGHENALVAGIRRRFGKSGIVDIVGRTPRKIRPMRAGFQDIVLKIILMKQDKPAFVAPIGKLFQPVPIPRITFCEIIAAETVPGSALAASGER